MRGLTVRLACAALAVAAAAAVARTAAGDAPPLDGVVGPDGWFRLADGAPVAWPADGVRCLVGRTGRVSGDAAAASVVVRGSDGGFETRALRLVSGDVTAEAFATAIRDAARARVADGTASRIDRWLGADADATRAVRLPTPPAPAPEPPLAPVPPDGAPLADRAPRGALFVRFRSVEAALRFCHLADRVAERLGGSGHGSLRLALHDLVLPEVWAANPNGEKGCGECALVVVARGGGRPEAALLLRITDPELHSMQTRAGIGWAAMPEHAWAPPRDPWSEIRARRNFRAVAGDVEVVATSKRALDAVLRRDVPSLADDPAWRALAAEPFGRDEAFVAYADAACRASLLGADAEHEDARQRADRMLRGMEREWRRWAGPGTVVQDVACVPEDDRRDLSLVAGIVSIRAKTDATGADVVLTCADAATAESVRASLDPLTRRFDDAAAACAANRRELAWPALTDRDAKDLSERAFVVLGLAAECPSGGTYEAHPVTREVSCSRHGSDRRPDPSAPVPRALLRSATADGAVVRLRVSIDWR